MIRNYAIWALGALALAAPLAAHAQSRQGMTPRQERPLLDPLRGSEFACADGGHIVFSTFTRDAELMAVVQTGEARHELPLRPWKLGDLPQVTWSDGMHTLTWNPGVQLMWTDEGRQRNCARAASHQH